MSNQVGGSHYESGRKFLGKTKEELEAFFGRVPDVIDFCDFYGVGNREFSAIKYLVRHPKKNGDQDVCKAVHYCCRILEDVYGTRLPEESVSDIIHSWKNPVYGK